jgi:hypothetical protein
MLIENAINKKGNNDNNVRCRLFPSESNNLELSKNCQLSEGIKGHASAHARTHGTNPAY